MKKSYIKNWLLDLMYYILGAMLYSIAIPMFIAPAHISPGGFTGVALIFNYLFGLPVGLGLLALNIPLLIVALIKFGKTFIVKTSIATVIVSLFLDISEILVKPFIGDIILSAIFGGILTGAGLGIILFRGATTGGVDIIGKIVNSKHPHISVGRIILISDCVVVSFSAIFYKDLSSALYSAVTIFITSIVLDRILYGAEKGKLIYIITCNKKEICRSILIDIGRGVTCLKGIGGFSQKEQNILLCAARNQEVSLIRNIVKELDKNAFIIICDAGEIKGNGFLNII